MTHQQSDAKEAYNHYYEFIVNCNPFIHTQDSYNRIVTGFIEKLSSDFLLHTRDKLPIISLKDAQRLWKEVDAGYFVWVLDKPFYAPTHKKIDRVNIENYLFLEHREILKKLEQVEPANPTGQAMPEAQNTASTPQTPAGATVNNTPLCFTYNKQSLTLTLTNNHGNPMKLSKQKAKLFNLLKKPKGIRLILKKLYSKQIEKNQKIADSKRNSYDSFASKFNEDWRDHFELNEELKLIQCDNEIVSIVQRIDWK